MKPYSAKILWRKQAAEAFVDGRYSRAHSWIFDGGIEIPASASPHVVPLPMSTESAVDPEEAFIASLSSCHMLWFLSIAAGKKYAIESYEDNAEGILEKDEEGNLAMTRVTLRPRVKFSRSMEESQIDELHELAHEKCFLARSVKTTIHIEQVKGTPKEEL